MKQKNGVCSLQLSPRESLQDVICPWKWSRNYEFHSEDLPQTSFMQSFVLSVLSSFCYLGKMRPRPREPLQNTQEADPLPSQLCHSRICTGSRFPSLTAANQIMVGKNYFFLKPLSYGSSLSTSMLTKEGSCKHCFFLFSGVE